MVFRALLCLLLCVPTVFSFGGVREATSDDKNIQSALSFAMKRLNMESNNYYRFMSIEVLDATKQVVAGMNYCVVAAVGSSSRCQNDPEHSEKTLKECPVKNKEMECRFIIWVRLWLEEDKKHNVTSHLCVPEGHLRCPRNRVEREAEPEQDVPELPKEKEEIRLAFNQFVDKYQKSYQTNETEFEHRYGIFKENVDLAHMMQESDRGTAQYGITQFSDLTKEEFLKSNTMNGWGEALYEMKEADIPDIDAPASFDWRNYGVVSEVKNQGTCGSCWAFSTTGNIEGQWTIKTKKLISLSEQELVDCDKVDQGCNGGLPSNAYKQIIKLGGLESESQYPYRGEDDKCQFNKKDVDVYINGSVKISSNEDDMAAWLASKGPISIGINAMAMQFYLGGVAHPWKIFCNPSELDHGVLIVGYGVKKSFFGEEIPYWIIKNSWGKSWGVQGYYLIYRGDGSCGLNTMCTSATID